MNIRRAIDWKRRYFFVMCYLFVFCLLFKLEFSYKEMFGMNVMIFLIIFNLIDIFVEQLLIRVFFSEALLV